MFVDRPVARLLIKSTAELVAFEIIDSEKFCEISAAAVVTNVLIAPGSATITFPIAGNRLPNKNVLAVETRLLIAGVISIPSAKYPAKFCAAAFIALNDPEIVDSASFAVVPVIPSRSCTIPIASITLSNVTTSLKLPF